MTKASDQFQPHILTKPPHKYEILKFSKGHRRGSSGRLGEISLMLQLIVYIYKILFFVYLNCFQGWSESAVIVVGMIGRFFLSLLERHCFGI